MLYSYGYCYFPQRRRAAETCVAARRELKAFHFNGILKSKCLATQKTFSCVFVLFVVSKNPESPPCLRASLFSVFRRRLERERQITFVHCLRLTRRRGEVWEDIGERGYSPLRADSMTV